MPLSKIPLLLNPAILNLSDLPLLFTLNTSANISLSSGNGRGGGTSIRMTYLGNTKIGCNFSTVNLPTVSFSIGFRPTVLPTSQRVVIVEFDDGAIPQCSFCLGVSGKIEAYQGQAATILGVSSRSLPVNQQSHLEVQSTIHPSLGTMRVWLNEEPVLSLTNLNTRGGGSTNNYANNIFFGCFGGTETGFYDYSDIHIADDQIGDKKVVTISPTGSGAFSGMIPTGSASNWDAVNDLHQDGDATYVSAGVLGQHDTYSLADLSGSPSPIILAVSPWYCSRKSDIGTRKFKGLYRIGITNFLTSAEFSPGTAYSFFSDSSLLNPATSAPWTMTDVNNLELGQEISA
jgi:hypothetical protein